MDKKNLILIDIKHVLATPLYKNTQDFLRTAIKDSWAVALTSVVDEPKKKGINYIIGELADLIKVHEVKDQQLEAIIANAKDTASTFFQSSPHLELVSAQTKGTFQFKITPHFKELIKDLQNAHEVRLVHIEPHYRFKDNDWKQLISKLEEELGTSIQVLKSANELSSVIQGSANAHILTARPKKFAQIQGNSLSLIYLNHFFLKLSYKLRHEKFVASEAKPVGEISDLSQLIGLLEFLNAKKENPNQKVIRVGYNFVDKKFTLMQAKDHSLSSVFPIYFQPVDLRFALTREIDTFFHKANDFNKDISDREAQHKISNFYDLYKAKGKEVRFMDPPDSFPVTSSRTSFQDVFIKLLSSQVFKDAVQKEVSSKDGKSVEFRVPLSKEINPHSITDLNETIASLGMKYPLIVKTVASCSTEMSHRMAVALNADGLKEIEKQEPFKSESHLLQELINHDGRIYKLYLVGEELRIQQKQSLPNLTFESLGLTNFFFDSQKSFHELEVFKNKISFTELEINMELMRILSRFTRKELNLAIFGLDVVQETGTGVYYLLDLNYFPGYKCMDTEFGKVLRKHISEDVMADKQK